MRSSEMFMECLRTQHCHSKIVAPSCGFLFSFELCTELFSDLKSIFWKVTIRNNSATLKKVNDHSSGEGESSPVPLTTAHASWA